MEGWTAKDLVPLMKRLENYQKPCNNDTHGYDGPIAISNGGQITALAHDFLRASDAIGVPYSGKLSTPNVRTQAYYPPSKTTFRVSCPLLSSFLI